MLAFAPRRCWPAAVLGRARRRCAVRSYAPCCRGTRAAAASGAAETMAAREEVRGLTLLAHDEELHLAVRGALERSELPEDRLVGAGEGGAFADGVPRFDCTACAAGLAGGTLGRVLLAAGLIPSTHSFMQLNGHRLPDGAVLVADQQAGGKGRGGNSWVSPDGCLMFSACKQMAVSGQQLPFLQYVVALSVVQAVRLSTAEVPQAQPVELGIKWPNDLYAGGLKVGGVLCNSSYRDGQFVVAIGVGLNVSNRAPTTCVNALLGCADEAANPVTPEALLAGILRRLDANLVTFVADGFQPLEAAYLASWLHSGQEVVLEEESRRVPLTIQGLTGSGYLLAADRHGAKFELHPDGNSLDFFNGLVRKKLY
eukprot:jgi/Tetstr1/428385/TSEL_018419.t1